MKFYLQKTIHSVFLSGACNELITLLRNLIKLKEIWKLIPVRLSGVLKSNGYL
jgi:hypothetical protein